MTVVCCAAWFAQATNIICVCRSSKTRHAPCGISSHASGPELTNASMASSAAPSLRARYLIVLIASKCGLKISFNDQRPSTTVQNSTRFGGVSLSGFPVADSIQSSISGFISFSLGRFVWSLPIIGENGGGVKSPLIPRAAANLLNVFSSLSEGSECLN